MTDHGSWGITGEWWWREESREEQLEGDLGKVGFTFIISITVKLSWVHCVKTHQVVHLNMYSLLSVNFTSIKLLKKQKVIGFDQLIAKARG